MQGHGAATFRPRSECAFDVVALGEVMLRLDPGAERIRTASVFRAHEGGGEYNVASALSCCFGLRTAIVTALVDNEVGHLIDGLIRRSGVDVSFGGSGVRCLHTGGIFAALSASTADVAEEAMRAARRHGAKVSYDLNYRHSLWQDAGGTRAAAELNHRLLPLADVVIGLPTADRSAPPDQPDLIKLESAVAELAERYATLEYVAVPRRTVRSASRNGWSALAWSRGTGVVEGAYCGELDVLDRVGSGDGFLYGLLEGFELGRAVDYGAAHGALVMTTPGDRSSAWLADVRDLAEATVGGFRR